MMKIYVIGYFLLLFTANNFAQNRENKDSVFLEGKQDSTLRIKMLPSERDSVLNTKKSENFVYPVETKFILPFEKSVSTNFDSIYIQSDIILPTIPYIQLFNQKEINSSGFFIPYSYSSESMIEGIIIKGFYGSNSFTDYLRANIDIYVSKHHFRNNIISPYYYINGSVRAELFLKLTDRIQLRGEGQLSLRKGIDPKTPSLMGGANYYGAGMQIKITNKVGVGVGFTNNYYRGEWTKRTYIAPVGY